MNSSLLSALSHLSYLHLTSYGLVVIILLVALADVYLLRGLRRTLREEGARLHDTTASDSELGQMLHPAAACLRPPAPGVGLELPALQRKLDLAEASLFVPLRSKLSLTRDLSTLMGLIATLLALVAAAGDFAKHGEPQRLIGSVGTGCVATCVAAIGCAIALWNLSRLTRLRLEVANESERLLEQAVPRSTPLSLDPLTSLAGH